MQKINIYKRAKKYRGNPVTLMLKAVDDVIILIHIV